MVGTTQSVKQERESALAKSRIPAGVRTDQQLKGNGNEQGERDPLKRTRTLSGQLRQDSAGSKVQRKETASEQSRANRLQMSRMQAISSPKNFTKAAVSQAESYKALSGKQKLAVARANVRAATQVATAMTDAYKEVKPYHILIIMFAILGDLFTLIPFIGSAMAIFFSLTFIIIYAINGHYRSRSQAKIATQAICYLTELLPAINALPVFTFAAVVNTFLDATGRAIKKKQEAEALKTKG